MSLGSTFSTLLQIGGIALALVAAAALIAAVYFGYFYEPYVGSSACSEIPAGSIVLALGFEYHGRIGTTIDPGDANFFLARRLADCADRISRIYTQKAISDALSLDGLLTEDRLLGKVPVLQMHADDPGVPIRTLQALQLCICQMSLPGRLVLLAHDKQIERAFWDLSSVYRGEIIIWKVPGAPYKDGAPLNPLFWSLRELFIARPIEAFMRMKEKK